MINETLSRTLLAGEVCDRETVPAGQRPLRKTWVTVVGIAADMRRNGMERTALRRSFYPSISGPMRKWISWCERRLPPASPGPAIRREIASLDPGIPVYRVSTLEERLTAQTRFRGILKPDLLSLFAAVALFLAAVGIYGVLHYSVAQRTNEIGIRMAMGARPADVLSLVLGQGCRLAVDWPRVRCRGFAAAQSTVRSLPLFGVTSTDPLTFTVVVVLLGAVVVMACWFRRGGRHRSTR